MIDPSLFEQKLWNLNSFGDYQASWNMTIAILDREHRDHEGNLVDLDYLSRSYASYLAWWDHRFGDREPKFIRSADSLKSVLEFLRDGYYRREWKAPPRIRDAYLFGGRTVEEMRSSLECFKQMTVEKVLEGAQASG